MSRERLEMSREAEYRMYSELRQMGETHEAACQRLGVTPRTFGARVRRDQQQGVAVPEAPEGYSLTENWNEPKLLGIRAWLNEGKTP